MSDEFELGDDFNTASTIDTEYSEFVETTSIPADDMSDETDGYSTETYTSDSDLIAAETDMETNTPTGLDLAGISATSKSNKNYHSFVVCLLAFLGRTLFIESYKWNINNNLRKHVKWNDS